jgi:putative ABC transport system permease protein
MKLANLAVRDLARNPRRSLVTMASVAVSLFVFSALISLVTITDQLLANAGGSLRLVCHTKAGLGHGLPEAYGPKIRALPHVRALSAWNFFGSRYRRPDDTFPTIDVDVEDLQIIWPEWEIRPDDLSDFRRIRTAALVAPELMRKYRWRIGDKVSLFGVQDEIPVTLEIVGTLGPKAPPNYFIFRREYLKEVYKTLPHRVDPAYDVDFFWIKADRASSMPAIISEVDSTFHNSAYETETESEAGFVTGLVATLGVVFTIAKILGAIVLTTMILVAANTAAMSVRERQKEVAVMRAIGFTRSQIVALIVGESLTVAIAGGIVGCAAAYITLRAAEVGRQLLGPFGPIRMSAEVAIYTFAAAVGIGLLSGIGPAISSVRSQVAESLRAIV